MFQGISVSLYRLLIVAIVVGLVSQCDLPAHKGVMSDKLHPSFRVQFVNKETGWIIGPRLLRTKDAGRNWETIEYPDAIRAGDGPEFAKFFMQFVDQDWGWRFSRNTEESIKLEYTKNGGKSWSLPLKVGITGFHALVFPSREKGWVLGSQDILDCVYVTSDGGHSWKEEQSLARLGLSYPFFLNEKLVWLASRYGVIAYTLDGGKHWSINHNFPEGVRTVFFVDQLQGWAAGDDGLLIETKDGGITWLKKNFLVSFDNHTRERARLLDIFFLDAQRGWIAGHNGLIFITYDGGNQWHQAVTPTNSPLSSIWFVDSSHGWATGGDVEPLFDGEPSNVILGSQDGGKSWQKWEQTFKE